MNKNSLEGFLWFYFFVSIIGISVLLTHTSRLNNEINGQEEKIEQLIYNNKVLSQRLSVTQDSLEYATSQDILWLSRVLYTETDKPLEMYYIAHVVKNRVETCYNGECSYKRVILDPYEFSAFNPSREGRYYYMNVNRQNALNPGKWAAAKQVALDVYMSNYDPTHGAKHFFAQRSMENNRFPYWSYHGEQVSIANNIDKTRLRIYKNVR